MHGIALAMWSISGFPEGLHEVAVVAATLAGVTIFPRLKS